MRTNLNIASRIPHTLVGLSLLAALCGCGSPSDAAGAKSSASGGRLEISVDDLQIGEIIAGETNERILHVFNPSEKPVEVGGIRTSCNCESVIPDHFSLAPHQRTQLVASLFAPPVDVRTSDTTAFEAWLQPRLIGSPNAAAASTLRGTFINPFSISPVVVEFLGQSAFRKRANPPVRTATITCRNTPSAFTAKYDQSLLIVSVRPRKDNPKIYDVAISPRPNAPTGLFWSEIEIAFTSGGWCARAGGIDQGRRGNNR